MQSSANSLQNTIDVPYQIRDGIGLAIKDASSLAVIGNGLALQISISMLQVIMAFREPKSVREAFDELDLDVDLEQFGGLVRDLADRGLLTRKKADTPGLQHVMSPRVSLAEIAHSMRQGRPVVVPDAFPAGLATEVQRDLEHARWAPAEGGHYRNAVVDRLDGLTPALTTMNAALTAVASRELMTEISGEDCMGDTQASAAWYRPYDYAAPHSDSGDGLRTVSFLWYLSQDWRPEWGGSLFWCPTGQHVYPRFNTLVMFLVRPSNLHAVCPVSPAAREKRLAINVFWRRRQPLCAVESPMGGVTSPPAYGYSDHSVAVIGDRNHMRPGIEPPEEHQ